jgi:hypothetical protein
MALDPFFEEIKKERKLTLHYYGDLVRFLFLAGAVLMLLTLPFINNRVPVPIFVSILAILTLALVAGFTNPRLRSTVILDTTIAISAFIIFEYYAVSGYIEISAVDLYFVSNQLLAIIFLIASYYSTKTLRGMFLKNKS